MAKRDNVSAPPPPIAPSTSVPPTPTPTPTPPANEAPSAPNVAMQPGEDGPSGNAASATSAPTGVGDPDVVQPEIGGKLITDPEFPAGSPFAGLPPDEGTTKQTLADAPIGNGVEDEPQVQNFDARDGAHAGGDEMFGDLAGFDPATNLGDWDGDGKAGGSVPAVETKPHNEKTNTELGTELGTEHAGETPDGTDVKKVRVDVQKFIDEQMEGKLPNGKPTDDEFWTAYEQAYEREKQQLAADKLSGEDRLRRVEKALGLLSPRD